MPLRKFDDETGAEIPLTEGVEVLARLESGTARTLYFASFAGVPRRLLDGTIGGERVAELRIRDLAVPVSSVNGAVALLDRKP
jgi:hypothetical protein